MPNHDLIYKKLDVGKTPYMNFIGVGDEFVSGAYYNSLEGYAFDPSDEYTTASYSDLTLTNGEYNIVSSASRPFVSGDVGKVLNITGGAGWAVGVYKISAVNNSLATLVDGVNATVKVCGSYSNAETATFDISADPDSFSVSDLFIPNEKLDYASNAVYAAFDVIMQNTGTSDDLFVCTTGGTTHLDTPPTWAGYAGQGDTATDGTVVWVNIKTYSLTKVASKSRLFTSSDIGKVLAVEDDFGIATLIRTSTNLNHSTEDDKNWIKSIGAPYFSIADVGRYISLFDGTTFNKGVYKILAYNKDFGGTNSYSVRVGGTGSQSAEIWNGLSTPPDIAGSYDLIDPFSSIETWIKGEYLITDVVGGVAVLDRVCSYGLKTYATTTAFSLYDKIYKETIAATGQKDIFVCTTAGTTSGTEPTWTNYHHKGDTVTDGTVVWTNLGNLTAKFNTRSININGTRLVTNFNNGASDSGSIEITAISRTIDETNTSGLTVLTCDNTGIEVSDYVAVNLNGAEPSDDDINGTFKVEAKGTGTITIRWYGNGKNFTYTSGATNPFLTRFGAMDIYDNRHTNLVVSKKYSSFVFTPKNMLFYDGDISGNRTRTVPHDMFIRFNINNGVNGGLPLDIFKVQTDGTYVQPVLWSWFFGGITKTPLNTDRTPASIFDILFNSYAFVLRPVSDGSQYLEFALLKFNYGNTTNWFDDVLGTTLINSYDGYDFGNLITGNSLYASEVISVGGLDYTANIQELVKSSPIPYNSEYPMKFNLKASVRKHQLTDSIGDNTYLAQLAINNNYDAFGHSFNYSSLISSFITRPKFDNGNRYYERVNGTVDTDMSNYLLMPAMYFKYLNNGGFGSSLATHYKIDNMWFRSVQSSNNRFI